MYHINLKFADYITRSCYERNGSFIFTASDVFSVRDTGVVIGMIKAYSLSVLSDKNSLKELVRDISDAKSVFDKERYSFENREHYKPVDMVYRRDNND